MSWLPIALLGGAGGGIAWLLSFTAGLRGWTEYRSYYRNAGLGSPGLAAYFDFPAELLALLTKILLGFIAALIFRDQVELVIGVGAAGPEMLLQLIKRSGDSGSSNRNSEEVRINHVSARNDALRHSAPQPGSSPMLRAPRKRDTKYQASHRKGTPRAGMSR